MWNQKDAIEHATTKAKGKGGKAEFSPFEYLTLAFQAATQLDPKPAAVAHVPKLGRWTNPAE
jgi:hypothetical protein